VRATRAYLAGFGTSGSLLAGAALMFLLASAFVAFRGWPQVAGQSAPVLVSVPSVNAPGATRASRVLGATTASPSRRVRAGAGGAAGRRSVGFVNPAHGHRGSDQTNLTPVSRDPGSPTSHTGGTPGPIPTPTSCTSNCGHSPGGGSSGPLSTVHKVVSSASSSANATVGGTVTTVKKLIPGAKGSSGGGGAVGGTVTTVKKVVGGATGGLP
jgi:hypothetical protein